MDHSLISSIHEVVTSQSEFVKDNLRLNGILYRYSSNQKSQIDILACSLTPYVIPAEDIQMIKKIQIIYQKLLTRAIQDKQFLNETFKQVAKSDDFVNSFLNLVNETFDDKEKQEYTVTICRNDYLKNGKTGQYGLVEFNVIAVGLGSLTQRLSYAVYDLYHSPFLKAQYEEMEKQGLQFSRSTQLDHTFNLLFEAYQQINAKGILLVINEKNQKNIFDQRCFANFFFQKGIKYLMISIQEAADKIVMDQRRRIFISSEQVSIVYFRSGFKPTEYSQKIWTLRKTVELSKALKLPTLAYQLINFKRGQIELDKQQVLKKFLTQEQAKYIRQISTSQFGFEDQKNLQKINNINVDDYVLKPNRQGGGNNFYGQDIITTLKNSTPQQAKSYVLMKRVPVDVRQTLVVSRNKLQLIDSVSQFGQFGSILTKGDQIISNRTGGYLLRSKIAANKQGGVSSGNACLDTFVVKH